METTVSYLLMLQKHIDSKQKKKKWNKILYTVFRYISKNFIINNMKKTGLSGVIKFFLVDFNPMILTIT